MNSSIASNENIAAARKFVEEGRGCWSRGDLAQAEDYLNQALQLAHDNGEAHWLLGEVMMASARIEDAVDCFQLAVHFSPRLAVAQLALANALLSQGAFDAAESACRVALEIDSASGAGWFCLGNVLKARGELAQAIEAFCKAAGSSEHAIAALQQLAFVESRLGRYDEARRDFELLLAKAPDSHRAHHNFGLLQLETGYAQEALTSFQRALDLQPNTLESMTCLAHALRDLGRLDEAIKTYDAVLARRPDFGDAIGNCALALLMRGDFAGGWGQYESRFGASGRRSRSAGAPLWQGESLANKSIWVVSEQGVGDEIMFASCLPDLMASGARVNLECDPKLTTLFSRSFPSALVQSRDRGLRADIAQEKAADFEISIGSLPLHYRNGPAAFPPARGYLRADPEKAARWRSKLAAEEQGRRIGIAWRGGTLRNRGYLRSMEAQQLLPLLRRQSCSFSSLQYGDHDAVLKTLGERAGVVIHNPAQETGADLDELAAVISALDLVITVDNTIAHMGGALGVPTWVMLPFSAEWRYGREPRRMPWYASVTLFRQPGPRDWDAVVAAVASELDGWC